MLEIHYTFSMKYNECMLHTHNKKMNEDDLWASPANTGHNLEPMKPCSVEVFDYCPKSSMFLQEEIPLMIGTSPAKDSWLKYTKRDKCPTTYPIPFLLRTVATPLWPSVRMKLTLPKLGTWSPSGL
jgi:hypothetical protein